MVYVKLRDEVLAAASRVGIVVRELLEVERDPLRWTIRNTFTHGRSSFVIWEDMKHAISVQDKNGWEYVAEFVGSTQVIMFFNKTDEQTMFLFEKGIDIVKVLADSYHFEFYLTDAGATYSRIIAPLSPTASTRWKSCHYASRVMHYPFVLPALQSEERCRNAP